MRILPETLTRFTAGTAAALGAVVLLGWIVDSPMLKGAIGAAITMKTNTALGLVLYGAALWLGLTRAGARRTASRAIAVLIAALGALTFLQHVLSVDFRIDQLLFDERLGEAATSSPNRMGMPASLSFFVLGFALLSMDWQAGRDRFPFRYLPLLVTAVASISLVGYAFGSTLMYSVDRYTGIAWPTALALLLLSVGTLTARPENPLVRILMADHAGGSVARQMLLPAVLVPFVMLLLYDLARDNGLIEASLGRGVLAVLMMTALTAIVVTTAQRLGVAEDERSRTHRALERAEIDAHRLSAIVESSNDAIVGKDLNSIVTSWNRAAEKLFGYTAEEMIGESIVKVFPAERTHEELEILSRVRRGEKVEIFDAVRRRKDGSLINVSLSISPILDREDRVVGVSNIARDITERKRTEAERESLLQSERAARADAERAARLRDEFIAVVSHELRTPLNGILGWAHYLKRARVEGTTLAEGIAAIERGARAQAQLVDDLLDMNRISTGRLALNLRPVDLSGVVESAIATVRPTAAGKNVTIGTMLDGFSGTIVGDPDRLQQVVWNLLSNAVKFTPSGGRVDVVVQRVDGHVEIEVRDTGIGIEPDFLPLVFERFRQADSSLTRSHGGMGLGLSIAKQLAELHGGSIGAESAGRDRGAVFTVRLPIASVRDTASPSALAAEGLGDASRRELRAVDLTGIEVLVVDDDRDTRELVERVLSNHHAKVTTAASAAEALAVLRDRKMDVLVSDIGMPGTDGYELIRQVRHELAIDSATTPAVAVTAYARPEDRARAMLAGYQMHIAKPIEPHELAATVASFAGRTQR